jgi:hypothetical protein
MAAVTQIRYRHTKGRACYDKKLAEGKTGKEALRALKRQISDAIFACLQEDARRAAAAKSPGGQPGNHSASRAAGSHPATGSSGKPLPGLPPTLRSPLLLLPRSCHLVRANGRVQDRAQPGRAAAPAGRPRRGRARADNARSGKGGYAPAHSSTPAGGRSRTGLTLPALTLKQRGVRSARVSGRC